MNNLIIVKGGGEYFEHFSVYVPGEKSFKISFDPLLLNRDSGFFTKNQ